MHDIDDDMISRAQAGDAAAFEGIYRQYSGMVYRVALKMLGQIENAEEVTQEVFVAVHRHLRSFTGASSLKTWIYRVAVNCSLNELKKIKRRPEVTWEEGFDPAAGPDQAAQETALHEKLGCVLDELNPGQKMCLVLRVQEGLSYDEIARALGININTVRSRLKRARETLMGRAGTKRGGL